MSQRMFVELRCELIGRPNLLTKCTVVPVVCCSVSDRQLIACRNCIHEVYERSGRAGKSLREPRLLLVRGQSLLYCSE
jgi:hypothetical protein